MTAEPVEDGSLPDARRPVPPVVKIRYRNGMEVESPVRYLGWIAPDKDEPDRFYHGWRVLNEGPYDSREGDGIVSFGGTHPRYIEVIGTGPR